MIRPLFIAASVVSLLMCIGIIVLWVQGGPGWQMLSRQRTSYHPDANGRTIAVVRILQISAGCGEVEFSKIHYDVTEAWALQFNPEGVTYSRHWNEPLPGYSPPRIPRVFRHQFPALDTWTFTCPMWCLVSVMAVLPVLQCLPWVKRLRNRSRTASDICPVCGYDLRASADRCPECGTAIPATS